MKKNISFKYGAVPESKAGLSLAKNDFKTKYGGSYLGIVWAFIQPIVTILVCSFVFSVGLKAGTVSDYPFVLYLVSGIVPWFFFQDALNGGTNALIEYNYLGEEGCIQDQHPPIVKIISALLCMFSGLCTALVRATDIHQAFIHCRSFITLSALSFVLGLVYVYYKCDRHFFRDLTQIISIFLQVGVWLTPDHVGYQYAFFTSMADQAV